MAVELLKLIDMDPTKLAQWVWINTVSTAKTVDEMIAEMYKIIKMLSLTQVELLQFSPNRVYFNHYFTFRLYIDHWDTIKSDVLLDALGCDELVDPITNLNLRRGQIISYPLITKISIKLANVELSEIYLFPGSNYTKDAKGIKLSGVIFWFLLLKLLPRVPGNIFQLLLLMLNVYVKYRAITDDRLDRVVYNTDQLIQNLGRVMKSDASVEDMLIELIKVIGLRLSFT